VCTKVAAAQSKDHGGESNGRSRNLFERQVELPTKWATVEKVHFEKMMAGYQELKARMQVLREELAKKMKYQERIVEEMAQLKEIEAYATTSACDSGSHYWCFSTRA
jgi:hypothetical protein